MTIALWRELGIVIGTTLVVCAVFSVRLLPRGHERRLRVSGSAFGKNVLICLPLAIIGWAAGYLTGLSRQPAVTAAIPAILTLAGALFAYVSLSRLNEAPFVALGVSVFAITVIMSTAQYSSFREKERLVRLLYLSEQERTVRIRRANMDLPDDIPPWIISDEPSAK